MSISARHGEREGSDTLTDIEGATGAAGNDTLAGSGATTCWTAGAATTVSAGLGGNDEVGSGRATT